MKINDFTKDLIEFLENNKALKVTRIQKDLEIPCGTILINSTRNVPFKYHKRIEDYLVRYGFINYRRFTSEFPFGQGPFSMHEDQDKSKELPNMIDLLNKRREDCIKKLDEHKNKVAGLIENANPTNILNIATDKAYLEGKKEGIKESIEIVKNFIKPKDLL